MTEYFYLDEHHNILTDDQARDALQKTNDSKYLSDGQGVVRVPKERWHVAQDFERRFWLEKSFSATEDRNSDHLQHFDGYRVLRGLHFDHAIELGCGPFTNLRLIASQCDVKQCTLLDPLIESYQDHPNHTYCARWLRTGATSLDHFLSANILLRAVRRGLRRLLPRSLEKRVRVDRLLACPIEEMPLDTKHDMIVIINVIEHCYDIQQVFENIRRISMPGAMLVFADRYYDHQLVADWITRTRYDAGHPLLVDRHVIDSFLDRNYEPLFRRVDHHDWIVREFDLSHDCVYFIGRCR